MVYELQVWWLMLILNQRSIGGWEVLALIFMYTLYTKSLYQVVDFIFFISVSFSLFLYNGVNREILADLAPAWGLAGSRQIQL
jgi:hypothetical protein